MDENNENSLTESRRFKYTTEERFIKIHDILVNEIKIEKLTLEKDTIIRLDILINQKTVKSDRELIEMEILQRGLGLSDKQFLSQKNISE